MPRALRSALPRPATSNTPQVSRVNGHRLPPALNEPPDICERGSVRGRALGRVWRQGGGGLCERLRVDPSAGRCKGDAPTSPRMAAVPAPRYTMRPPARRASAATATMPAIASDCCGARRLVTAGMGTEKGAGTTPTHLQVHEPVRPLERVEGGTQLAMCLRQPCQRRRWDRADRRAVGSCHCFRAHRLKDHLRRRPALHAWDGPEPYHTHRSAA